jgi:hypothetical protein
MLVFWVMAPSDLVCVYQISRGTYTLHLKTNDLYHTSIFYLCNYLSVLYLTMFSVYNGRIISKNYDNEAWKLISNHTLNIISYENHIHDTNKAIKDLVFFVFLKQDIKTSVALDSGKILR